jgi:hypothetical protein
MGEGEGKEGVGACIFSPSWSPPPVKVSKGLPVIYKWEQTLFLTIISLSFLLRHPSIIYLVVVASKDRENIPVLV